MGRKNTGAQSAYTRRASGNSYSGIDSELVKIVKKTASRALGKAGFTKSDLPDIEQELIIAALEGLKFLRKNSQTEMAFIFQIVSNRLKSILRSRHRKSQNWHGCCLSLNITIGFDDGGVDELISLIDNEYFLRNNSCRWHNPCLNVDLVDNLNDAIKTLPKGLRKFCEELKKKSLRQVSHDRKISTKSAYQKIADIREEFKQRELLLMFSD